MAFSYDRPIQLYAFLESVEKYLEGAYTVRASVGHIRDLPKSNKQAIDIPGGFIPHYEISKGKEKVVNELQT
ncbi:MAG: hypothetical protein WCJ19_04810, partial [bacterium]